MLLLLMGSFVVLTCQLKYTIERRAVSLSYIKNFPKEWEENSVERYVADIATDPKIPWNQITFQNRLILSDRQKFIADGLREGKKIRVVLEPYGRGILTAYLLD